MSKYMHIANEDATEEDQYNSFFFKWIRKGDIPNIEKRPDLFNYQRPSDGFTPLHIAVSANILEGVLILLGGGANPNVKSRTELLPLDLAVRIYDINQHIIIALLTFGAKFNIDKLSVYIDSINVITLTELENDLKAKFNKAAASVAGTTNPPKAPDSPVPQYAQSLIPEIPAGVDFLGKLEQSEESSSDYLLTGLSHN